MNRDVRKRLREGAVWDTKSAGFCTGECGTTGKECKECKKSYIKNRMEWWKSHEHTPLGRGAIAYIMGNA